MEECQLEQKEKAVELRIKWQEQHEFYKNSIQEGKILRMAMNSK